MSHMKNLAIDEMNKAPKEGDIIKVCFNMRVINVTSGKHNEAMVFGLTASGDCVSAPLDSVVERG